jgi:hypothetical protein
MDYLGLFCLGVFAGTIASFGMTHVSSVQEWQTVLAFSLPAVLGGAAMVLVERFADSAAFGCYPAGLVAALIWAFTPDSLKLIKSGDKSAFILGYAHLIVAALVTLTLAAVATVPAILQIGAELNVPNEARWILLLKRHTDAAKPAAALCPRNGTAQRPASGR